MDESVKEVLKQILVKVEDMRKQAESDYGKNDEYREFHFAQYCALDNVIKDMKKEYGL